jgi:hypothetical protein
VIPEAEVLLILEEEVAVEVETPQHFPVEVVEVVEAATSQKRKKPLIQW